MSQDAFADTTEYTIRWDEDLGAVVHEWNNFSTGDVFREACEELLEFVEERNASKLLVDQRDMEVIDQDDQEWLMGDWTPRVIDAGLKATVIVYNDSVIAKMNVGKVMDAGEDIPYDAKMTSDISEARAWIRER